MRCYASDFLAKTREIPKVDEKMKDLRFTLPLAVPRKCFAIPALRAAVLGNSLVVRPNSCNYDRAVVRTASSVAIAIGSAGRI